MGKQKGLKLSGCVWTVFASVWMYTHICVYVHFDRSPCSREERPPALSSSITCVSLC